MNVDRLRRNVEQVRQNIQRACRAMKRDSASLTVVAVTKGRPAEAVRALHELGVSEVGENRVQEAVEKQPAATRPGLRWHMIGHLQSNKARRALDFFEVIHSIDRPSLAQELQKLLSARGRGIDAFVQVNVAGERQKEGIAPEEVVPFVDELRDRYPLLRLQGLMTLAPLTDDPEKVRWIFARLRELSVQVALPKLSMGMTQDYVVAIEEGATHLRIGSAYFDGVFAPRGGVGQNS
ncbi:MAG TPA: YggS family pyridoxal phosphate-dependent enzyme [Planctomycetota bacterium]|nr:YggS family pyridoxal phosphate-dependent enzyme [Planctomycetota bacterium]